MYVFLFSTSPHHFIYFKSDLVRPVRPVHPLSSLWAWTAKLLNDLHYPVYCFMIWLCMLKESPSLIEVLIGTAGVLLLRLRRYALFSYTPLHPVIPCMNMLHIHHKLLFLFSFVVFSISLLHSLFLPSNASH